MSNKLNLGLKQGEDFQRTLTIKDENGIVINLTGYTFTGQVRASYSSDLFLSFTFTLANQTTNTVSVMPGLSMARIPNRINKIPFSNKIHQFLNNNINMTVNFGLQYFTLVKVMVFNRK